MQNNYIPGDVVNDHMLGHDNMWHQLVVVPPPPADFPQQVPKVNNAYLWMLVFAVPIVVVISVAVLPTSVLVTPWYWPIAIIGLNTLLALVDERELEKTRPDSPSVSGFWASFLVPVYLWKRRKITLESQAPLIVWLVIFALAVLGW